MIRRRFDTLNRRRAIEYPDQSRTTFDYDPDSNLIATRDNNGVIRNYTVDSLGRTIRIDVDTRGLVAGFVVEGASINRTVYYVHAGKLESDRTNVSCWSDEKRAVADGRKVLLKSISLVESFLK